MSRRSALRTAVVAVLAAAAVAVPGTSALAASTASTHPGTTPRPAKVAPPPVDRTSRAAVGAAYRAQWTPSQRVPVGWTGSVSGCVAGEPSAEQQTATIDAVNFARRLAGLSTAHLAAAYSIKAQQAALVYQAQGSLSHDIPTSWRCATEEAQEAGAHANIALGVSGARAIGAYLGDDGTGNTAAGHRRWILSPADRTMGSGSTASANALWVIGGAAAAGTYRDPAWVSWPASGWFPKALEPNGRWSLSGDDRHSYDFGHAHVTVATASGRNLAVRTYPEQRGYGSDTLVWQVHGVTAPRGTAEAAYRVSVTGIVRNGVALPPHRYSVRLFDPMVLVPTGAARITGRTAVGQRMTAVAPGFSPAATGLRFQWTRNGHPIRGATSHVHVLRRVDAGTVLRVQVTGRRAHYRSLVSTSGPVHVP